MCVCVRARAHSVYPYRVGRAGCDKIFPQNPLGANIRQLNYDTMELREYIKRGRNKTLSLLNLNANRMLCVKQHLQPCVTYVESLQIKTIMHKSCLLWQSFASCYMASQVNEDNLARGSATMRWFDLVYSQHTEM